MTGQNANGPEWLRFFKPSANFSRMLECESSIRAFVAYSWTVFRQKANRPDRQANILVTVQRIYFGMSFWVSVCHFERHLVISSVATRTRQGGNLPNAEQISPRYRWSK